MRHRRTAATGLLTATLFLLLQQPGAALSPAAPKLDSFGKVLQRHRIKLKTDQHVVIGETFHGPGAELEFGLVEGRWRDRLYYRGSRRILREWEIPGPGLPDSALSWGRSFAALFRDKDTLFVELHQAGDPGWATGARAVRMESLFRKWIERSFGRGDWAEAAALGVSPARFQGPPPELVCPLGGG